MRNTFSNIITELGKKDEKILFLTGDLGFNALEPVKDALGERFINMGVAEQNMVSAAAGFAYEGYKVFCYSIAPFIVYRCLEQTRNDVCFHNLPVFLVANGGGYGYGIMGMSHHTLDDLSCLSGLINMNCYIPAFKEDVSIAVKDILKRKAPAYLRLGLGKNNPFGNKINNFFNRLISNNKSKITVVGSGPVLNNVIAAVNSSNIKEKVDLFSVSRLPYEKLPQSFITSISGTRKILIVEEHIRTGGIAEKISYDLLSNKIKIDAFKSLYALGYPGDVYGSQNFHFKRSFLDSESISRELELLIK